MGRPNWLTQERYNIDARVADSDAEAWRDPVQQKEMLHAMMQTLLADGASYWHIPQGPESFPKSDRTKLQRGDMRSRWHGMVAAPAAPPPKTPTFAVD